MRLQEAEWQSGVGAAQHSMFKVLGGFWKTQRKHLETNPRASLWQAALGPLVLEVQKPVLEPCIRAFQGFDGFGDMLAYPVGGIR